MRPTQYFSEEYLQQCRSMRPEQIVRFLDDFRTLHAWREPSQKKVKSRAISLKIPEPLLEAFKTRARLDGMHYQTQIKHLMSLWLDPSGSRSA